MLQIIQILNNAIIESKLGVNLLETQKMGELYQKIAETVSIEAKRLRLHYLKRKRF